MINTYEYTSIACRHLHLALREPVRQGRRAARLLRQGGHRDGGRLLRRLRRHAGRGRTHPHDLRRESSRQPEEELQERLRGIGENTKYYWYLLYSKFYDNLSIVKDFV